MLGEGWVGVAEGGKDGWIEGEVRKQGIKGWMEGERGRATSLTEGTQGHKELLGK